MLFNQTVEHILLHQEVEYKMGSAAQPLLDQVYGAIADPTRRAILTVLAGGEANVGSVAGRFPISLNAVSKHVKVLERAGLVRRRILGREHVLRLNPGPHTCGGDHRQDRPLLGMECLRSAWRRHDHRTSQAGRGRRGDLKFDPEARGSARGLCKHALAIAPGPPAPDPLAVAHVGIAEGGPQGGFLVRHHEQMRSEREGGTVAEERPGLIEQRRPRSRTTTARGRAGTPAGSRRRAWRT
jgi:DNA-binding transcriptional ArsR family regulator